MTGHSKKHKTTDIVMGRPNNHTHLVAKFGTRSGGTNHSKPGKKIQQYGGGQCGMVISRLHHLGATTGLTQRSPSGLSTMRIASRTLTRAEY